MDPQPVMLSEASVFRTELGGTLTLPCAVKDLGPFILIWKKGNRYENCHKINIESLAESIFAQFQQM